MREGPFGLPWFWNAVLVLLILTTGALVALVFVGRSAQNAEAAAEAARYVPPVATAAATPQSTVPTVAFIGDSYAAGTGASRQDNDWVNLLSSKQKWAARDLAFGGTGYITNATDGQRACGRANCPAYSSVIATARAVNPSIVVVSGGRNDVGQPSNDISAGIQAFYKKLRAAAPDASIVAIAPIWDDDDPPAQLSVIQADVKAAVAAVGGTYLEIGEPLKGHPDYVTSDGIHPNDRGHAAIAAAVNESLE